MIDIEFFKELTDVMFWLTVFIFVISVEKVLKDYVYECEERKQ